MTRDFLAPPLVKNGNPLSAYGINQIIDSVNSLKSNYFDFNVLNQRNVNINNINAWTTRYALVHVFDYLYINLYLEDSGPVEVYIRPGQNGTPSLLHTFTGYSAPTYVSQTINISSLGYNYGDVYLITLDNTSGYTGGISMQYLFEWNNAFLTLPTIPTLSSSTVVDETYLNNIITLIRDLPPSSNVNIPFNGVGAPGDYNASAYMRWLGHRRSRYLSYGFRLIDVDVTVDFYINGQLINTVVSGSGTNSYNLYYDFQTNPAGITVPSIGTDYEFSVQYSHDNETSPAAACFIDYAWEADYL